MLCPARPRPTTPHATLPSPHPARAAAILSTNVAESSLFGKHLTRVGVGPWRLGHVPLIDIYPYDRFRQAYFETTPRR